MHNGNVVVHTTYGQVFCMFYGQTITAHTIYRQVVHIFYGQQVFPLQHIDNFSIYCMDKKVLSIQ